MFDILCEDIVNISCVSHVPICLIGDFNSRTGTLNDFLCFEDCISKETGIDMIGSDVCVSRQNLDALGIETSRFNQDKTVNNNGRRLIEMCRSVDVTIANGRLGSDRGIGSFTCQKTNGCSVVDYVVLSQVLMPLVQVFKIHDYDPCLSDVHCLIQLTLECPATDLITQNSSSNVHVSDKDESMCAFDSVSCSRLIWDSSRSIEYKDNFIVEDIERLTSKMEEVVIENISQAEMDSICKSLCNVFLEPAKSMGIFKLRKSGIKSSGIHEDNVNMPWFTKECEIKRAEYFKLKNKLCKLRAEEAKTTLKMEAKKYKRFI